MQWETHFQASHPTAHALLARSLIAAAGLTFGNIKVRGIGLGIAGVLFAGIAFGHFGVSLDRTVVELVRELGPVLFV
jgi:putative transport protein